MGLENLSMHRVLVSWCVIGKEKLVNIFDLAMTQVFSRVLIKSIICIGVGELEH